MSVGGRSVVAMKQNTLRQAVAAAGIATLSALSLAVLAPSAAAAPVATGESIPVNGGAVEYAPASPDDYVDPNEVVVEFDRSQFAREVGSTGVTRSEGDELPAIDDVQPMPGDVIVTEDGYQDIMPLGGLDLGDVQPVPGTEIETGEGYQNIVPIGGMVISPAPITANTAAIGLGATALAVVAGGVYMVARSRKGQPAV